VAPPSLDNIDDLISQHARFDLDGPHVDSAGHALGRRESLLPQPIGDSKTSTAMMAVDDNFRRAMFLQFVDSFGHLTHREQHRTFDFHGVILRRFAAIDEKKMIAGIEFGLNGRAIDFERDSLSGHIDIP
jgi:hypothetical protein